MQLHGVLAQLARALDWQSKGQGFDSPILHQASVVKSSAGAFLQNSGK